MNTLLGAVWQTARTEYDRARVRAAVRLSRWVEETAASVRKRRGREFIGPELDEIDMRASFRESRRRTRADS